jgi:arylsulfatase
MKNLLALSLILPLTASNYAQTKPNIIVILADDLGYSDIGCYGSEIRTPNLDHLASEGLRMTQFYNCSRSCPSRASLLTGLYSHRAGIGDMVGKVDDLPAYQGRLNNNCVTIAEVLKQNDYNTYMAGKWHVGEDSLYRPLQRGFDRYFGILGGAGSYFNPRSYRKNGKFIALKDHKEITEYPKDFYLTDAITDYALDFIKDEHKDTKPFFLYIAYTAPHWPLHAKPEDIKKYKGKYMQGWTETRKKRFEKMKNLGIIGKDVLLSEQDSHVPCWDSLTQTQKEHWDLRMAVYAAMIESMDSNIGRITEALKKNEIYNNTLIIFLSDNGASHEDPMPSKEIVAPKSNDIGTDSSFAGISYQWANTGNTPFRFFKTWEYEGGIATPFIAHYPNMIKKGIQNNQPAHIMDIAATIYDITGASYPQAFNNNKIYALDGISFKELFESKSWLGHKNIFWEHEGNCAVRNGNYKIVMGKRTTKWELYDMDKDPTELNDLAPFMPEKAYEMQIDWLNWAKDVGVIPVKDLEIIKASKKSKKILK